MITSRTIFQSEKLVMKGLSYPTFFTCFRSIWGVVIAVTPFKKKW